MACNPAHSGMLIMILALTGLALGSGPDAPPGSPVLSQAEGPDKDLFPHDPDAVEAGMASWREAHPVPSATLTDVADHINHVRKVAGIDHVGVGSDFDGISTTPVGLEDVSTYPALLSELLRRGYSEKDVKQVAGLNLLRVMRRIEKMAAGLQRKTAPSDALIEELDTRSGTREAR